MRKKSGKKRAVKVGDWVRFKIAAREIVAEVVEDRGYIGMNGRHVVAVRASAPDGEVEKFDWPADELTVLPKKDRAPA